MSVAPAQRASPSSVRGYTLHSGDTLWGLASKLQSQGVRGTHQELISLMMRLNPSITNPNHIVAGRSLKLPSAGTVADGFTPSSSHPSKATEAVAVPKGSSRADAVRARVAQWAIAQANDPSIGYSQTKGRFGNVKDSQGHRYFDCSGLVYTAYQKAAGVKLGGNWTGAMRATWPKWADRVPKNVSAMKPGDLILMNGHVVMYTGNGKCVGAQTSHTTFRDQVTTGISAAHYLARADAIVLRPRV
jgi:cell wall-associated NlpC family hydrolase